MIPIKKTSSDKQTVTSLSSEIKNQISANTNLDTTDYTATEQKTLERGKRSDDLVQLKFSRGKRAEAKAFYALYDVKMNAGFEMAYEFLKEEVLAGRVRLSKSGVQRISGVGETAK